MVTEERIITFKEKGLEDYLTISKGNILPSLRSTGGKVLCMLKGLVGRTPDSLTQLTFFENLESWQTSQGAWITDNDGLIQNQTVRLLRTLGSRPNPKVTVPPEQRRLIYQYESSTISPTDFSEFILCNEEGVWPEVEKKGASVLGMWALSSTTSPVEIITLTGYETVSHWEELHFRDMTQQDDNIWSRELQLTQRLKSIVKTSRLDLMISAA